MTSGTSLRLSLPSATGQAIIILYIVTYILKVTDTRTGWMFQVISKVLGKPLIQVNNPIPPLAVILGREKEDSNT